jgi:hypothetical protein
MVWCPSYPPSVCFVTEGGGVMQRGPIRSLGSVSNVDRQCNPCLFGDGFVNGKRKEWRLPASDEVIGHIVAMHLPRVASNAVAGRPA